MEDRNIKALLSKKLAALGIGTAGITSATGNWTEMAVIAGLTALELVIQGVLDYQKQKLSQNTLVTQPGFDPATGENKGAANA